MLSREEDAYAPLPSANKVSPTAVQEGEVACVSQILDFSELSFTGQGFQSHQRKGFAENIAELNQEFLCVSKFFQQVNNCAWRHPTGE